MDSHLLAQAVDYFNASENRELYNIHSMTILRNGHLVADVYFYPYEPGFIHLIASTTKVFITTLIGIAIDSDSIDNVDTRLIDFFPDRTIANLDDRKRRITLEHLLTMTSGLGSEGATEEDWIWESDGDWVQACLDLPMSHEPGTWWNYHSPTAFLVAAIVSEATDMSPLEFARERLFGPLGITTIHWDASPGGVNNGADRLFLSPHDLAKFGQLFLQRGVWRGERLVSESWIDAATTVHVPPSYGYMWTIPPEWPNVFIGGGGGGQRLVVSPERNLVVVLTGGGFAHEDIERIYLDALDSMIFPSVQSDEPLPANPAGWMMLEDAIGRAAESTDEPSPTVPLPPAAAAASGRTYDMNDNPAEIRTVALTFAGEDELHVRITTTGDETIDNDWVWAFGLDGVRRCVRGEIGVLACGTGTWLDQQSLEITVDALGVDSVIRFTLSFFDGGDRLDVRVEDLDRFDPDPTWTMTGTARF
jgi:hypothetical protein